MAKKKILHIAQELPPYVPSSIQAEKELRLIQDIANNGEEIRIFLPKWGVINERRNQLHEVIRLSGANIVINNSDHPLIIKVASLPSTKIQAYFIDSEDFFTEKIMSRAEDGKPYQYNVERAVFFARGVLETVKKLKWTPDVIHCHGWISTIAILYLKTIYKDLPQFANAKIVFSAYDEMFVGESLPNFETTLHFETLDKAFTEQLNYDYTNLETLSKIAIKYADAYVESTANVPNSLTTYAKDLEKATLSYNNEEDYSQAVINFYETL